MARLARLAVFDGCDQREVAAVDNLGTPTRERPGTVLARQGSVGREVFLIEAGSVAVERDGVRIATLGPGDVAGEMGVLARRPRCARLVTDTEVLLRVYTPSEFDALLEAVPSVRARVYGELDARTRVTPVPVPPRRAAGVCAPGVA